MNAPQLFEHALSGIGTGGATTLEIDAGHRRMRCDVTERNSLAVSFSHLCLTTRELANADAARLERLGKALAARLTYLMEPISPVEHDAAACVVQLRSNPPQRDDDGRSYFELLVRRGGEIALSRFRKENSGARQPIAATVTREVLLRLVKDFDAVLD
jgi:hypothetical protein